MTDTTGGRRKAGYFMRCVACAAWFLAVLMGAPAAAAPATAARRGWVEETLTVPYRLDVPETRSAAEVLPTLTLLRQDFEELEADQSVLYTPMVVGSRHFQRGLGTHSASHIRVRVPAPMARFSAWIGVDNNWGTRGGRGSVVFRASADGREVFRSKVMRGQEEPRRVDLDVGGSTTLDLHVDDAEDGPACDHADWAKAKIAMEDGTTVWLDDLVYPGTRRPPARYPFSFVYDGRHSDALLTKWTITEQSEELDANRTQILRTWNDPQTGLSVEWRIVRFADYPAAEWMLRFRNTGAKSTPIIEDLQSLNLLLTDPIEGEHPFVLHRTKGGFNGVSNHESRVAPLRPGMLETLGGFKGHSNRRDFPYFRVDARRGSVIVAVGWSGQWKADVDCREDSVQLCAGLEKTHFRLHPGEEVRSPRMLLLFWEGARDESHRQFRRLLYEHYIPRWKGKRPDPFVYCNTCFTHKEWLNETNEANQLAMIRALKPLALEAIITDAGWFQGAWPNGVGTWEPDPAKYPRGIEPLAAAARECGAVYGLWFEPERAAPKTAIYREHPEWLLERDTELQFFIKGSRVVNFALPEVRAHMLETMDRYMKLPGFAAYRHDCNIHLLPFWRRHDAADRQGIAEMKYIAGLYAYWDALVARHPDCFRVECSGAGPRTDLETVMRFHVHQVSECYNNDTVNQAVLMSVGQYLPNGVVMTPLFKTDPYGFYSAMASSLCLGWAADEPEFDMDHACMLLKRYRQARRFLNKDCYPLTPYSVSPKAWLATQYHSPEDEEGIVLLFRREQCPQATLKVSLGGLRPEAFYELVRQDNPATTPEIVKGADLMRHYLITLDKERSAALMIYRRIKTAK
ncbi:MAG: alpha-galactosidase [Pirellulales bacterium]|nr:alpha-galactosidase [Pirellulales bacterium]